MNTVKFTPFTRTGQRALGYPVLCADQSDVGSGFVFQAIASTGTVEVETYHATFPDALAQVASAMTRYGHPSLQWRATS